MKRRDSSTALHQEDILCATSCEIYIPVPNLELNQDGQMQHVRWSQQNLTLHGFCDIYLLKYSSTSCRKSVLLDITDDCHKIELDITLNKILEEKLRYNKKTDTWYEFWSHVGERNYNTTIKLDKNDEEFLKFSEHLEQVLSTLEECQKKKTVVECTYKIVAFQAAKKSQENLNTFGRREKIVVQEKEFLDSIGLPPSQCGNIDRQTDNKIAREITEPPFSPKPFHHINTEFISQGINSNENNLEKSLYLKPKNNLSVKNVLTGLDHVPSAKSVLREIEEVNLVSNTSQYENMMDRDKSLGVATSPFQRLVELLQAAINSCDKENAAKHAESLAATGANVNISLNTSNIKKDPKDTEFSIDVHVEDREASGGHVTLKVKPTDTVGDLKLRMCLKHNFPVEVQKWIIGKRIPPDKETLQKARVTQGQAVYLYLVSCKSVGLTREKFNEQKERMLQNQYPGMRQSNVRQGSVNLAESGDYIPMGTPGTPKTPHSILPPSRQRSEAPNSASPGLAPNSIPNIQPLLHQKSKENQGRAAKPKGHTPYVREQSLEGFEVVGPEHIVPNIPPQQNKSQTKTQIGWICPACTYINQPTRPGCEICATNRPVDYIVPDGYQMTKEEEERIRREQELEQQAQRLQKEQEEIEKKKREENFEVLLQADDSNLIPNTEMFQCPICFDDILPGSGVVLRDCLHSFCRDCLKGAVIHSEEAELRCPYQDESYTCQASLQEREIRALVEESVYEKHLQRSLVTAESQERNSFHCKTTDCQGWCIYEDLVNFFKCPVCNKENCLTCKAIHEGMDCKQYQEDLRVRANNNKAAKQTNKMLKDLLKKGDAMKCPQCEVIVQKKDGCDWIKCSICKTEICWVTKGPRWGPLGVGDISGGCKCRVDGKPCHENCNNCH